MKIKFTTSKNGKLQFSCAGRLVKVYKISGTVPAYVMKKGAPAIEKYVKKFVEKKKSNKQVDAVMAKRAKAWSYLHGYPERIPKRI